MRVSIVLNLRDVRPKRSRIFSTIAVYCGESVVAYASRFLLGSPSSSPIMRRVSSSMSDLEEVKPT